MHNTFYWEKNFTEAFFLFSGIYWVLGIKGLNNKYPIIVQIPYLYSSHRYYYIIQNNQLSNCVFLATLDT